MGGSLSTDREEWESDVAPCKVVDFPAFVVKVLRQSEIRNLWVPSLLLNWLLPKVR